MRKNTEDYERVVEELIKDSKSYDSWSDYGTDEESEIRDMISESIWGEE